MSAGDDNTAGSSGWADQLQKLRANPRVPLILAVAAAAAILVGILLWSTSGNYGVLFSGLSDQAGGKIVAQLDKMNEPYQFRAGGSTILIPKADVDGVRLKLAGDGLPKRGGVGFGLMDNEPLGISKFAEHINYQRALQGELARSIRTIGVVSSARVNLALPKNSVFVRQRKHAKASVIVTLYSGRSLSAGQVQSIQHLVASSVSRLPVAAVTVIDGQGTLLSRHSDSGSGMDTSHLVYVSKVENAYRKKIDALLTPILGSKNFRVQVNADLNFASNEQTREQYAPNQNGDDAAVRSKQSQYKSSAAGGDKGGIPGALSNQPSPNKPSPINNPNQQIPGNGKNKNRRNNRRRQAANGNANSNGNGNGNAQTQQSNNQSDGNRSTSKSSTTNYELNHTVEHIKQPMGRLKRISAAVVINAQSPTGSKQPPATNTPPKAGAKPTADKAAKAATAVPALSQQQIDRITALVRSAIGYSQTRGDVVSVLRSPFNAAPEKAKPQTPPWWQNGDIQNLFVKALTYLVVLIVAFLVWRKILKPLVDSAARPRRPALANASSQPAEADAIAPQPPAPAAVPADEQQREQRREQHAQAVNNAQDVARDDPRMVAMIVKNWMRNDD